MKTANAYFNAIKMSNGKTFLVRSIGDRGKDGWMDGYEISIKGTDLKGELHIDKDSTFYEWADYDKGFFTDSELYEDFCYTYGYKSDQLSKELVFEIVTDQSPMFN